MKRNKYAYALSALLTGTCLLSGCGSTVPQTQTAPNTTINAQDSLPSGSTGKTSQNSTGQPDMAAPDQNTSQQQNITVPDQNASQQQNASAPAEYAPAESAPGPQNTTVLSEAEALETACAHAGVSSANLLFSHVKQDFENGRSIYEVEFYADNQEYDYEIDAASGQILNYDMDMESSFLPPSTTPSPNASAPSADAPSTTSQVDIETASQTALARVPGASASDLRIKMDRDDGRSVYEGKIIYHSREYEFEIDAATGTVTEWDEESIYD